LKTLELVRITLFLVFETRSGLQNKALKCPNPRVSRCRTRASTIPSANSLMVEPTNYPTAKELQAMVKVLHSMSQVS
jgi:hypothetical protein